MDAAHAPPRHQFASQQSQESSVLDEGQANRSKRFFSMVQVQGGRFDSLKIDKKS